jgi:hypothetical protein
MQVFYSGNDEEMKLIVNKISAICLSSEFRNLCLELEGVYRQCRMDNATALAFQDALYAMLMRDEEGALINEDLH